ncbi:unnamed protein product [Mycena citricolor]|uniref:Antifreeze protein n=1 Tax=Mycena citricolor TaxID=2018698 RepID=A0AAD2K0I8_9AGAR|nr:unnamed protein product [Mycena citricolor]
MVHISSIFVALTMIAVGLTAPVGLQTRQIGNLDCNLSRLRIITDTADAESLISQINSTSLDTTISIAIAQAGLKTVDTAIHEILQAVFSNQTAPAAARTQVGAGLAAAQQALAVIQE